MNLLFDYLIRLILLYYFLLKEPSTGKIIFLKTKSTLKEIDFFLNTFIGSTLKG